MDHWKRTFVQGDLLESQHNQQAFEGNTHTKVCSKKLIIN